jgi:Spy/CpxP family protein refolding chaperone
MPVTKQLTGILATLLLGTGAMLGCGGSAATNAPPASVGGASAEEDDATAGLVEHHRHHHHGGVMLLIAMSLDTLGLSPEQKPAVEKIRSDLHARMEPARAAEQNLVATLADGLAAGTLDPVKVDAAVAQLTSVAAMVHDASTDALNQLHAVLTPPQRAALVDKLEAHWSVWQRANTDESDHVTQLTADLDLTPDQVDKIRASQAEAMKAVPRFDPRRRLPGADIRREGAEHHRWRCDGPHGRVGGCAHGPLHRVREPGADAGAAREARTDAAPARKPQPERERRLRHDRIASSPRVRRRSRRSHRRHPRL